MIGSGVTIHLGTVGDNGADLNLSGLDSNTGQAPDVTPVIAPGVTVNLSGPDATGLYATQNIGYRPSSVTVDHFTAQSSAGACGLVAALGSSITATDSTIGLGDKTASGPVLYVGGYLSWYMGGASMIGPNTSLGADRSPSDILLITGGTTTGTTTLSVANTDGLDALTTGNGIFVVDVKTAARPRPARSC